MPWQSLDPLGCSARLRVAEATGPVTAAKQAGDDQSASEQSCTSTEAGAGGGVHCWSGFLFGMVVFRKGARTRDTSNRRGAAPNPPCGTAG
jgi:hypothetical protein